MGRQPEPLADRELAVEGLGLVAVPRDDERARGPVADVDPGDVPQLGGERRPAAGALQAQEQQVALLRVGLRDGREHPGRDAGGPGAGLVALEDEHAQAAGAGAPRDGEAGHAGPDDDDVGRFAVGRGQDAPRFAGMTRISC